MTRAGDVFVSDVLAQVAAKDGRYAFLRAKLAADGNTLAGAAAPGGGADRFPLPLCRYEGGVREFAACGCADKHVRNCDHPEQGNGTVPEIDLCTRGHYPLSLVVGCEVCTYRVAPHSPGGDDV